MRLHSNAEDVAGQAHPANLPVPGIGMVERLARGAGQRRRMGGAVGVGDQPPGGGRAEIAIGEQIEPVAVGGAVALGDLRVLGLRQRCAART